MAQPDQLVTTGAGDEAQMVDRDIARIVIQGQDMNVRTPGSASDMDAPSEDDENADEESSDEDFYSLGETTP
jgi:hypothetical protein